MDAYLIGLGWLLLLAGWSMLVYSALCVINRRSRRLLYGAAMIFGINLVVWIAPVVIPD